jgi:hypothetical protein
LVVSLGTFHVSEEFIQDSRVCADLGFCIEFPRFPTIASPVLSLPNCANRPNLRSRRCMFQRIAYWISSTSNSIQTSKVNNHSFSLHLTHMTTATPFPTAAPLSPASRTHRRFRRSRKERRVTHNLLAPLRTCVTAMKVLTIVTTESMTTTEIMVVVLDRCLLPVGVQRPDR